MSDLILEIVGKATLGVIGFLGITYLMVAIYDN